jgi:hypothetical protein
MSFKKKLLAFAAVSALTAATAVPAMALENEFHGMYKMKYFVSNIDNGASGTSAPYSPSNEKISSVNYFEQRARLFYTAKANDNLKLVLGFEIDSVFGDRSQGGFTNSASGAASTVNNGTAFRNSGGALDTDAVNLETKWVHLDFNIPGAPVNVKVGTQPIKDSIKGIMFDLDAAGIYTASKFGDAQVNVGYFRGYEGLFGDSGGAKRGVNNLDIAILEGKYNVSKDISVGAAYYGYYDYRQQTATMLDHTFAVNADAKVGPVALSGFLAGQVGDLDNKATGVSKDLTGYAANVAAKLKAGPGTAKLAFLYTSGDKDNGTGSKNKAWQSVQQDLNGVATLAAAGPLNTYNESGMMLLNRNAAAAGTSTDRNIVDTTNNKNQGVTGFFVGYDATLSPKLLVSANAGIALTSENNASRPLVTGTALRNSSNFLGTEVNVEAGYKLYDNLTASVQAAYVFLGDYYEGTASNGTAASPKDPMNPYTTRLVLSYVF